MLRGISKSKHENEGCGGPSCLGRVFCRVRACSRERGVPLDTTPFVFFFLPPPSSHFPRRETAARARGHTLQSNSPLLNFFLWGHKHTHHHHFIFPTHFFSFLPHTPRGSPFPPFLVPHRWRARRRESRRNAGRWTTRMRSLCRTASRI